MTAMYDKHKFLQPMQKFWNVWRLPNIDPALALIQIVQMQVIVTILKLTQL